MMKNRGFTLIELLVVIAIIGTLSSIVLASLNSARDKGANAAIKADISGLRAAAELYFSAGDTYGAQGYIEDCGNAPAGSVFNDSKVQQYIDDAIAKSGRTITTAAKCFANATTYVIAVQMKSSSSIGWCVDSVGSSRQITWGNFASGDTKCADAI